MIWKIILICIVGLLPKQAISSDNYILFQTINGSVLLYNVNNDKAVVIDSISESIDSIKMERSQIIIYFNKTSSIIETSKISNFYSEADGHKKFQKLNMKVEAKGESLAFYLDQKLQWEKIHKYKSFYAKGEGYLNASIGYELGKIIAERNWLGFFGFLNPSICCKESIVEVDLKTQKETVICKNCSKPVYSSNEKYILCVGDKIKGEYILLNTKDFKQKKLKCKKAFWVD